jgi:hypothetical protein
MQNTFEIKSSRKGLRQQRKPNFFKVHSCACIVKTVATSTALKFIARQLKRAGL